MCPSASLPVGLGLLRCFSLLPVLALQVFRRTLDRVDQAVIRRLDLLEHFRRIQATTVRIGVPHQGHLAVGLLDLFYGRGVRYFKE